MSIKTIRKNVNFPESLLDEISYLAKHLEIDFSKFVREASVKDVNHLKKIQLQKELEEGYKAKSHLNLKISDDFKHVDGENI